MVNVASNPPLISIITVSFRQTAVTCDLLHSIQQLHYPNLEVIVVDNGSLNDPTAAFKKALPAVKVIVSEKNLGFAGGNNLGIEVARGDFLLFINNDTVVEHSLIENLLVRFNDKKVGVASPKICYYDSPRTIQYAGFTDIHPLTGRNVAIGKGELDEQQHDVALAVPFAHGAAMMVRREVIDKVGKMPESFFLYYEELDWCVQIRKAGFEVWYEPTARILHKESISTGRHSPLKMFYLTRNRIRFMRRNYRGIKLAAFLVFFYGISFPKNTAQLLLRRDIQLLKAFFKGAFSFT